MFQNFEEYLNYSKPKLDDAFNKQLSLLLGNNDNGLTAFGSVLGGKRIRGCLLFMVGDILGGSFGSALPRAVAVELIHSASLIHDDFVDQDTTRRNLPSVWTVEGSRKAVLLGDLIFASAIAMMSDLSREDGLAVSRAIALVSKGAYTERLDPRMLAKEIETDRFDNKIYGKIISLKTGILFGTACQLGAISAGAGDDLQKSLFEYGLKIGEAYQMADDIVEIKHHLQTRSINKNEMAALTPTLCYFVKETIPYVIPFLSGKMSELDQEGRDFFQTVEKLMEDEIQRRMGSAISIITTDLSGNENIGPMCKAPGELIGMFFKS